MYSNNVENMWRNAKMKQKAMAGCPDESIPGYLDEFMWRQRHGRKTFEAFENLFIQISQWYTV